MRGPEAFKPFYELVRAAWSIFPALADVDVLGVTTPNGAECKGIVNGRLTFWIDPNYVVTDIIAYHECGHAFEALLEALGVSKDRLRTALWQFRQYASFGAEPTWQQQDAYARTLTGGQQWQNLPVEIVAETWRCGHMGAPTQERTAYFGPIDNAAQRAFYKQFEQEVWVAQTDYPGAAWIASPNYTPGRPGGITDIVEHWTVAPAESVINTFKSSASRVSAHYMVERDGTVVQFVREKDSAWHDSSPGWNDKAIGIEHEHEPGQDWPVWQLEASQRLHLDIRARRGAIPATGHGATYEVFTTQCPGDLPIYLINEEDDMFTQADRDKLQRVYDMTNAEGPRIWTQRLQDWLSKALKSMPSYARPIDYTGPDVTSGQPRT